MKQKTTNCPPHLTRHLSRSHVRFLLFLVGTQYHHVTKTMHLRPPVYYHGPNLPYRR